MIIRAFKKSYLLQYILLVLLLVLLWGGAFLSPPPNQAAENPFLSPGYALVINLLGDSPRLLVTVAFLLVLVSALLFNYTLEKNGLSGANSLIPALVFALVMSLFPSLQTLHPALIPGFLMVVVLSHVFAIYKEDEPYIKVFNAGFYIALSSLFYFPSIVFIFFVWFTFIAYSLYRWREWVILLFGSITPYILIWTWFFWTDELGLAFQSYSRYFAPKLFFDFGSSLTLLNYFSMGLILVLFIRGLFIQTLTLQEKVISIRKRFSAVILFFAVSALTFVFSGDLAQFHVVFIQVSVALVIQGLMFRIKRYFFSELLFWLYLLLVMINNYYVAFQSS